jgi:hypothetical protein
MELLLKTAPFLLLLLPAPAVSQQKLAHSLGSFEWKDTSNGIVISAPHGTFDRNTAAVAIDAAKRLNSGYLVARGFNPRVRINVSRPTEGASLACREEQETARAQEVFAEYDRLTSLAAGTTPLKLYVEVHGNSRPETSRQLEIATTGVSISAANIVKSAYASILSTMTSEWPDYPALRLLIEPADRIYWTAACGKRIGTIARNKTARVLHFEFPMATREERLIAASGSLVAKIVETLLAGAQDHPMANP